MTIINECASLDFFENPKWRIGNILETKTADSKQILNVISELFEKNKNKTSVIIKNMLKMLDDKDITQMLALEPEMISLIINPTEEMQNAVITNSPQLAANIKNLSEFNFMRAISYDSYVFANIEQNCQTVAIIKRMYKKHKNNLKLNDILPELLESPDLKHIIEELEMKQLGEV